VNVSIHIQYDAEKEGGQSDPLSFNQIDQLQEATNAPGYATINMEQAEFGWDIYIHWNTDVRKR
jgi:hypothetical protein